MSKNKLFVFEFISCGGFNQEDIPTSLFCEGFGMLRAIIEDFKALDFEIYTLLDYRLASLSQLLKADIIKEVNDDNDYLKKFEDLIKNCEFCFIIAPEFSNILYNLTKIAKDNGKTILSVDLDGITLGTHKLETYDFFKASKVNTPLTFIIPWGKQYFSSDFVLEKFKELKRPLIIKPEDGVGADSIFYFDNKGNIINFFKAPMRKLEITGNYILQEFIAGRDLSVSLIGTKDSTMILTINAQYIDIKNFNSVSEYLGGYTPVENYQKIKEDISELLKKMDLSKFSSYYGIDFIRKSDNTISLIEINPRLTTSYIGIRNIIDINPAELIWASKMNSLNTPKFEIKNFSLFTRIELNYLGVKSFEKIETEVIPELITQIPEFITPPVSFNDLDQGNIKRYSSFIATKTKDHESSKKRVEEIEGILKKFNFEIIKLK